MPLSAVGAERHHRFFQKNLGRLWIVERFIALLVAGLLGSDLQALRGREWTGTATRAYGGWGQRVVGRTNPDHLMRPVQSVVDPGQTEAQIGSDPADRCVDWSLPRESNKRSKAKNHEVSTSGSAGTQRSNGLNFHPQRR